MKTSLLRNKSNRTLFLTPSAHEFLSHYPTYAPSFKRCPLVTAVERSLASRLIWIRRGAVLLPTLGLLTLALPASTADLTWTGAGASPGDEWQGTNNWHSGTSAATFTSGDTVTFQNNAAGMNVTHKAIRINPGTINFTATVDNNATGFSFTGATADANNNHNLQISIIQPSDVAQPLFLIHSSKVDFTGLHFTSNSGLGSINTNGGGIYADTFSGNLSYTSFSGFKLSNNHVGGALYASTFSGNIDHSNFFANEVQSDGNDNGGGALRIAGSFTGNLTHAIFSSNTASNALGGAISVRNDFTGSSGTLADLSGTMFLGNSDSGAGDLGAAGALSVGGNFSIVALTDDVIFQGNLSGSTPNAINFNNNNGNHTIQLAATSGHSIWFYDPIASPANNSGLKLVINPDGQHTGSVVLDGYNWHSPGGTPLQSNLSFASANVNHGTLALHNGAGLGSNGNTGTLTIAEGAALRIAYQQDSRTYTFNSDGSYTIDDGAELNDADKENIISGAGMTYVPATQISKLNGALSIAGTADFAFPSTVSNSNTMLQVSGKVSLSATRKIHFDKLPTLASGAYVNLIAITGNGSLSDARLDANYAGYYIGNDIQLSNPERAESSDLTWGLRYDSFTPQANSATKALQLVAVPMNENSDALTWRGFVSGVWNNFSNNWSGTTKTNHMLVTTFLNKDSVIFDKNGKAVNAIGVQSVGVKVANMSVSDAYTFSGGTIEVTDKLEVSGNSAVTFDNAISGSGELLTSSTKMLTLAGSNSYTGTTTVDANALLTVTGILGSASNNDYGGATTLANNATLTFAHDDTPQTLSGTLTSYTNGKFIKNGNNTLTLTDFDAYLGSYTLNQGTLLFKPAQPASLTFDNPLSQDSTNFDAATLSKAVLSFDLGNSNNILRFVKPTGTSFTGTIEVANATISLDDDYNVSVLNTNPDTVLRLAPGGVATLTKTTPRINNLSLNGGELDLSSFGTQGNLEVLQIMNRLEVMAGGGAIRLDVSDVSGTPGNPVFDDSFYDYAQQTEHHAALVTAKEIRSSDNVTLTLLNQDGSPFDHVQRNETTTQNGFDVGKATFSYTASVKTEASSDYPLPGIYLGYGLQSITATNNSHPLVLDSDTSNVSDAERQLVVQLTGSGGFVFSGQTKNRPVQVGNATSDYTGTTLVSGQPGAIFKLTALSDNVFGHTSNLSLSNAWVDLGSNRQTVGLLDGDQNSTLNLGNNSVLTVNGGNGGTYQGELTGNGGFVKSGSGTLTLSHDNESYTGQLTVSGNGQLTISGKLGAGGSYSNYITVKDSNSILNLQQSGTQVLSSVISGNGQLAWSGTGTLMLTGTSNYSGGTDISKGTVNFTSAYSFGSGNLTLSGGSTLVWAANNSADISPRLQAIGSGGATLDIGGNDVSFSNALTGSGSLNKTGAGTLTLGAVGSYSGAFTVDSGALTLDRGGFDGDLTLSTTASQLNVVNQGHLGNLTSNGINLNFTLPSALSSGASILTTNQVALSNTNKIIVAANDGQIIGLDPDQSAVLIAASQLSGSGELWLSDASAAYQEHRGAWGTAIYDLQQTASQLTLVAANASENSTNLTWNGAASAAAGDGTGVWDSDSNTSGNATYGTRNWYGTVGSPGARVTTFLAGDSVTFSSATTTSDGTIIHYNTNNDKISVPKAGISVNNMTVNGNYTFTGGTITATGTLSVTSGASLGLIAHQNSPALIANTITYAGDGILNIAGLSAPTPGQAGYTLIHSANGITGLTVDPTTLVVSGSQIKVGGGSAAFDFVTTEAKVANPVAGTTGAYQDLLVSASWIWFADTANNPTGTFTLPDANNDFTVAVALTDRSDGPFTTPVWDGKSLTKAGPGKLTLSEANTYSGATTVSAGTLTVTGFLGSSNDKTEGDYAGAISIASGATLAFEQAADQSLTGTLTGSGALNKSGAGNLTVSANNRTSYTGAITVSGGRLTLDGNSANGGAVGGTVSLTHSGQLGVVDSAYIAGALAIQPDSTLYFSLPDQPNGKTMLTLGTTGSAHLGINNRIILDKLVTTQLNGDDDYVDLIQGLDVSSAGTGVLWMAGADSAYIPKRGTHDPIYGLVADNNILQLAVNAGDDNVGGDGSGTRGDNALEWTGDTSIVWDIDDATSRGSPNWSGMVHDVRVATFLTGDSVIFRNDPGNTNPQTVQIISDGVTVGEMYILGTDDTNLAQYNFTGGSITAQANPATSAQGEVQVEYGVLGLAVGSSAALTARSVSFDDDSHLNIIGYNLNHSDSQDVAKMLLVDTDNNLQNFDPTKITVSNAIQVDYLHAVASVENQDIYVETRLRWYSDANATGVDAPHGTFTLNDPNNAFTLGSNLNDRSDVPVGGFPDTHWDGRSLDKEGPGTLIIVGDMSYTGGTTIGDGTLAIGNGGTTGSVNGDIVNNSTLIFNRANNAEHAGNISGAGSVEKLGRGVLTLSGQNTYAGDTTISAGAINLTGSIARDVQVRGLASLTLSGGKIGGDLTNAGQSLLNVRPDSQVQGNLSVQQATLNFYVPTDRGAGTRMLTVGGQATIADSALRVGVEGNSSPLSKGDQIILIDSSGLSYTNSPTLARADGMQGITLKYLFDVNNDGRRLIATLTELTVSEQSKAVSEGHLAGIAIVNQGADLVAEQGMQEAVRQINRDQVVAPFIAMGGGSNRYKTGSHVDVKSMTTVAGFSGNLHFATSTLTLGGFFEYGHGSYDTVNNLSNAADIHGDGDTQHTGGGLLARLNFGQDEAGYNYLEATARMGQVKTDFNSSELLNSQNAPTWYETSTRYYGGHIGMGRVWHISENTDFDLYGKFLFTQRKSDKVRLSSGEEYVFDKLNSERLRVGARLSRTLERLSPYFGIAYEHELDGEADASYSGLPLAAPDLGGKTGIIEAGLTVSASKVFALDFGVQGYWGKRQGVSGSLKFEFKF